MRYDVSKYDRYVQFQSPTDVNTKGSTSRTWANTYTTYAGKVQERSDSSLQSGARTTEGKSTWRFPYNPALVTDGRFYEHGVSTVYYYVVGVYEDQVASEMIVEAEIRR